MRLVIFGLTVSSSWGVTFCFTPGSCGKRDHHTSPPHRPEEFADFCARVHRYA